MSGWIPQVHYDFLARVIPGSAVILGALYLKDGPSRGVGFVLRQMCDQDQDDHGRALEAVGRAPVTLLSDDLPDTNLMAEQLTVVDRYSGSRSLALSAERRLCLVLAFGFFTLAIGNLLLYSADLVHKRLAIEGLLLVGMLVLWRRSSRLHKRLARKTCIGWLTKILSGGFSGGAS